MILGLGLWFYGDYLLIDSFNFSRFNFLLFWCIILNLVKTRISWYFSLLLNWVLDYNFGNISIWFMITILWYLHFFVNWVLDTNCVIFCHFVKLDSWYQLCDTLQSCYIWFLITNLWYFSFLLNLILDYYFVIFPLSC